jgi:hypothetical protein
MKKFVEDGSSINFKRELAEFIFKNSTSSKIINLGVLFKVELFKRIF